MPKVPFPLEVVILLLPLSNVTPLSIMFNYNAVITHNMLPNIHIL